jgi:hypothetical protein
VDQGLQAICPGITREGKRCGRPVSEGSAFCHYHDPARAEQRSSAAGVAGRSRPLSESAKLRKTLVDLIGEVRRGETDPKMANAVAVLSNAAIGTLRLDSKIRELEDLEVRLREIEERVAEKGL